MKKRALITGAASGIGEAVARHLANSGYQLALLDMDTLKGKKLSEELGQRFGNENFVFVKCDVTLDLSSAFETASSFFNRRPFHVLINNAGISCKSAFHTEKMETFKKILDINVLAVIEGTYLGLKYLERNAIVINVASMSGLIPFSMDPVYSASKFAVVGFTRSCTSLYKSHGLHVSQDTPLLRDSCQKNQGFAKVVAALPHVQMEQVVHGFDKLLNDPPKPGSLLAVTPSGNIVLSAKDLASKL